MPINAASIPIGASWAPTGGSATTLKTKDTSVANTHIAFLDDASDLLNQTTFEFSYKAPKVQASAPNGYTQARNTLVIKEPFALDNGNITVNTVRVEVAVDFETTAAEKAALRELAIQAILDSDFLEFWDDQSAA